MSKKSKPNVATEKKIKLRDGQTTKVLGIKVLDGSQYVSVKLGNAVAYVLFDLFVSRKTEARDLLMSQGVKIILDADFSKIVEAVAGIRTFKSATLIDHIGWTSPHFALPDGRIVSPRDTKAPKAIFEKRPQSDCVGGTLEEWQDQVAGPIAGQELLMIAVLAALSAPMVELAGETHNFGIELSGPPETGKTTWLTLFASVAGKPTRIPTFNSTKAGFEGMFAEYRDMPFPIDEANLADSSDKRFMLDFVNRMSNGTQKVTAFQTDRAQYRNVYATTSNQPFFDALKTVHDYSSNAALQRLMPLRIDPSQPLGVFTTLPEGFESSGAVATYLADTVAVQYGTPMRTFVKALVFARGKNPEKLKSKIRDKIAAFEDRIGVSASARGKTRASSAFGLLYAAGSLAKAKNILPESWDCMAACVGAYRNYQSCIPDQTPLPTRLLTITQRRQTLDLRNGPIPKLSDTQIVRHGAFIKSGKGGRVELLLTEAIKRELFGDWAKLKQTADFKTMNVSANDHDTTQRQVRQGKPKERFFCFILPPEFV
jgi:Domain of unknown function (DUF927)